MTDRKSDFAVSTKLLSFVAVLISSFFISNYIYSGVLSLVGFLYLLTQKKYKLITSFGIFYVVILILLIGIRFYSLKTIILPEFYVLLFWSLCPIMIVSWDLITTPPGEISAFLSSIKTPIFLILGVLVVFRFFPTMKSEMKRISQSMKNRGILEWAQILRHPVYTFEYALVPLLIRFVQIADQLSTSAITRGALSRNKRESFYQSRMRGSDYLWICIWLLTLVASICMKGNIV